jgi:hypothetical protein
MKSFLLHSTCVWLTFQCLAAQEPAAKSADSGKVAPAPGEWSIRSYFLPLEDLPNGAPDEAPPEFPAADATEQAQTEFLRHSNQIVSKSISIPLPEGSLLAYDPAAQTLVVRTVEGQQSWFADVAATVALRSPTTVRLQTEIIETDAATIRKIVSDAAPQRDHAPLLARLQAKVDQGTAQHVDTLFGEGKSGQRILTKSLTTQSDVTEFNIHPQEPTTGTYEDLDTGAILEAECDVLVDHSLSLNWAFDFDYQPRTERVATVTSYPGKEGLLEAVVFDRPQVRSNGSLELASGQTRLLGVWRPRGLSGPQRADNMQAAFLTGRAVPETAEINPQVAELLQLHGEKVLPTPPTKKGGEWEFISRSLAMWSIQETAIEFLKSSGINLPEGSSAHFSQDSQGGEGSENSGILFVRTTPMMIQQIEQMLNASRRKPSYGDFVGRITVVQAEGALLRRLLLDANSRVNYAPVLTGLEAAVPQQKARILETLLINGRSGQRNNFEACLDFAQTADVTSPQHTTSRAEVSNEPPPRQTTQQPTEAQPVQPTVPKVVLTQSQDSTGLQIGYQVVPTGLFFEWDPFMADDGRFVNVNFAFKYHYAPTSVRLPGSAADAPNQRLRLPVTSFHKVEVSSSFTCRVGNVTLLSVWKPRGTADFEGKDLLQAAFMTIDKLK